MAPPRELIHRLKQRHPATWSLMKLAASQGLVELEPSGPSLEVSPELQGRHPRLYQILVRLLEENAELPQATVALLFSGATNGTSRHDF